MLRRFEWIRSSGIFDDFQWDASSVPDSARINVIYGGNGCGKTSLALALDIGEPNSAKQALLSLAVEDNGTRRSTNGHVDDVFGRIHVFSESYVKRSHRFSGADPNLDAVLTLGKRSVEAEERLAELRGQLDGLTEVRATRSNAVDRLRKKRTSTHEAVSKQVVDDLTKVGGRYQSRSHYSKAIVEQRFRGSHDQWVSLRPEQLANDRQLITAGKQDRLAETDHGIEVRQDLADEAANLLGTTPATIILDTLEAHPEATSWVQTGRDYHEELDQCIYCGSPLTTDRKADIDRHFSGEVAALHSRLEEAIADLDKAVEETDTALQGLPRKAELYGDLRNVYQQAVEIYRTQAKDLRSWATELRARLENKLDNVLGIAPDTTVSQPVAVDGTALDGVIEKHNARVADHDALVKQAAQRIEFHHLKAAEATIDVLTAEITDAEAQLHAAAGTLQRTREEIASLQNVEGDPMPSIEVLNQEVAWLLGRDDLRFEAVDSRYRVLRNGEPAVGLSVGERTAITLVHFMETVARCDPVGGKPIVVIDDPVSSLDSNIFMGVSTYIWSESVVKDHIEQLFLLTHNFELFRQWDIQLEGLHRDPRLKKQYPAALYELKTIHVTTKEVTKRQPVFSMWPPSEDARKKVRSTYHHAFMAVADAKRSLDKDDSLDNRLNARLLFPNVIRRMLETFIGFKRPDWIGNFTVAMRNSAQLLREAGYEGNADALRLRLTRYTHAHSHDESPDTTETVTPDEVGPAIAAAFEFMHQLDSAHFAGLCAAVGIPPDQLLRTRSDAF